MEFESEFRNFLNQNFKIIESLFEGRVVVYDCGYFVLRIVEDRNLFKSIEVSSELVPDNWFSLNVIRSFILKNDDYFKALDFGIAYVFIMNYFQNIANLFSSRSYPQTAKSLKELEDSRAEIKYGRLK